MYYYTWDSRLLTTDNDATSCNNSFKIVINVITTSTVYVPMCYIKKHLKIVDDTVEMPIIYKEARPSSIESKWHRINYSFVSSQLSTIHAIRMNWETFNSL